MRNIHMALIAAVLAFSGAALAEPLLGEQALAVRTLGDAAAPVTITDYSSLTCPHCATFHTETLPKLKEKYIDTGKAKLVFADFPLDGIALRATMISRCAPPQRYFGLLDVFFKGQAQWARAKDPVAALSQRARLAGMSEADVNTCLANEPLRDGLIAAAMDAQKSADIKSTPTFVLTNDKGGKDRIEGALPLEQFEAAIEKLLAP